MLMNYHQLTMDEAKDSPQRRYQHIVICSIIATGFVYSVWISGVLLTIEPFATPFPGGPFCYKELKRDYVASMGIGRRLQKEVLETFPKDDDEAKGISVKDRKKIIEDKVYHLYLDNPEDVGGSDTRWMSGMLLSDDAEKSSFCDHLFDKNPGIQREKEMHKDEPDIEKKASELFYQSVYKSADLPVVDSLAIKFPFSDGFLSGLVFAYKIIPEMRALAAEKGVKGSSSVVISQCSVGRKECTHYVPLARATDFQLGHTPTEEYQKGITDDTFNIVAILKGGLRVVCPFLKPYIDPPTATTTSSSSGTEEL